MSTTETTLNTPVEIDTRIAAIYNELANTKREIAARLADLHDAAGDRRRYDGHRFVWGMTDSDVINVDADTLGSLAGRYTTTYRAYEDLVEHTHTLCAELDKLDAIYDAAPWSRFYLVTNTNGHIHSTRPDQGDRCQTCYHDTPFGWLPALSGRTEADAVAEIGPVLCSVCFPSAPVEHTNGELHTTRQERETRQAERRAAADAKLAKRIEKALFADDPDRSIRWQLDRINTIAKARTYLRDGRVYLIEDGRHHGYYPQNLLDEVAVALAARLGMTVEAVWAEVEKKAQAQVRKNQREAAAFLARNPGLASKS